MTSGTHAVLEQALHLNPVERAELIEALYQSFNAPADPRRDAAWAAEAESRIDAYEAGRLTADSADAVLARIAKR